jgi:hypothetical protein
LVVPHKADKAGERADLINPLPVGVFHADSPHRKDDASEENKDHIQAETHKEEVAEEGVDARVFNQLLEEVGVVERECAKSDPSSRFELSMNWSGTLRRMYLAISWNRF